MPTGTGRHAARGCDEPGKPEQRRVLLQRRRQRPAAERDAAGRALADAVLALLAATGRLGPDRPVAAYVALPGEPPTGPLLAALAQRGVPVLLPVLLPDGDLDWAAAPRLLGGSGLEAGRAGTLSPTGPRLGPDAVTRAAALVVPGLAGDRTGGRLGRGGGSYDRALRRVPDGVPALLLLFDDEVVDRVPTEPHDHPVTHLVTPARTIVAHHMAAGLD